MHLCRTRLLLPNRRLLAVMVAMEPLVLQQGAALTIRLAASAVILVSLLSVLMGAGAAVLREEAVLEAHCRR
jgi:hypothetical protein